MSGVTSLALGQMHGLAGTAVGRMYSWGTDEFGALGRGEDSMKVWPQSDVGGIALAQ